MTNLSEVFRRNLFTGVISLVAVGILMVCTSTLMFVHNPQKLIVKMILTLSDGSLFYKLWSAPPFNIYLKIYIFNITNSKEFLAGKEKMNLTQLGPYIYREILTNQNATFNDSDGTVTYSPHREIVFDPDKSVRDPKKDHIMTTNLPLVGLQAYLNDASIFTNLAYSTVTRSLGSEPIMNVTVEQYLWGYKDPLIKYAHTLLPNWIDFDTFGIFERLMSRDNNNRVTIVTDPSKYHSKLDHLLTLEERMQEFHVVKWNNISGLKDWGFETLWPHQVKKCNLVEGAFDGTIFPRDLPQNTTLTLFRKAFCRPVPLQYLRDTVGKEGFRQYEYKLADNMFDVTKENECFCFRNKCIKGFQSIAPCYYGIPITLSQPHYFNADPKMLETVNGLAPNESEHGSLCAIQPDIGVPLSGSMKIQINLDVGKTKGNSKTYRFNDLQVPLFWVEITTEDLPSIVIFLLTLLCNVMPVALEVIKYLLGLSGLALISGGALYTLLKTKVRIPRSLSLGNNEYSPIPIVTLPAEFLEKCERRFSLK
ncbi:scavenger receptor class B member 1-like [Anthonomus grandis grandis]|uniref:scavenger receptor class B member 1-like n=1 Tax=Anthonomus grandis grandis TaxID=2921223 RepID=UPI0021650ADB|nr:scavenger receptor class B member 1-like [Anthonomus grandis grandis]